MNWVLFPKEVTRFSLSNKLANRLVVTPTSSFNQPSTVAIGAFNIHNLQIVYINAGHTLQFNTSTFRAAIHKLVDICELCHCSGSFELSHYPASPRRLIILEMPC